MTLRTTTERPVTVETQGNVLVGDDPALAVAAVIRAAGAARKEIASPPLWDGRAAERIVGAIDEWDRRGRPRRYVAPGSVTAIR